MKHDLSQHPAARAAPAAELQAFDVEETSLQVANINANLAHRHDKGNG